MNEPVLSNKTFLFVLNKSCFCISTHSSRSVRLAVFRTGTVAKFSYFPRAIIKPSSNIMQSASDVISSLFWFSPGAEAAAADEDNEADDDVDEIEEQFVASVDEFSSQYGSEVSVSYTAFNLRGPPSNFPDYGDYPQAFVMRTYGKWWEEAPSAQEDYMPQNNPAITSQDFVEVSFEHPVYPSSVNIFETYNPGAVVRVWAHHLAGWVLLWEGAPEAAGDRPRIFSPPLRDVSFATRVIRLEFNHRMLPYYTELDALLLRGKRPPASPVQRCAKNYYSSLYHTALRPPSGERGEILSRIMASNLHESVAAPRADQPECDAPTPGPPQGDFQALPDETILCILKYLDLRSLCRCAAVNRHFDRLAGDAILYRALNLRPYWNCLNSRGISTLSTRCKYLQKLDLSWCGSHGYISALYVAHFLKDCGSELTHLRLNSCKFVDNAVLKALVESCPLLQELCLRNTVGCTEWGRLAHLPHLRRLDLYRTDITTCAAVAIIRANPHLQHVNFGACWKIAQMDEVAQALGACCRDLLSADFWKSYTLTPNGIRALAACRHLQELDVGWCLQASASGEWLAWLAEGEGELRKLFLGALRGVSDRDLRALVTRTPHLQQLDLLGVRAITPDICTLILAECRELRLLDLSFCDQINESQVLNWRRQYPRVSIKRSFQGSDPSEYPPFSLI